MTHHIDTIRIAPIPMDFDTSSPEVNCLPLIVVHRGLDPVGHIICFGVKYLQVAATLGVQFNNVHIGGK